MMNKSIKDFIGSYDGYFDPNICDQLIDLFEKEKQMQKTWNRKQENTNNTLKQDEAMGLHRDCEGFKYDLYMETHRQLRIALDDYLKETDILKFSDCRELHISTAKIQKTLPSEGYHVWHVEKDYNRPCSRFLVYTIYLNDITQGGETEFLFQKTRVPPKKGRICFFPAMFPFVHRGNPPLNEEKYIATSWLHTGCF